MRTRKLGRQVLEVLPPGAASGMRCPAATMASANG